MNILQILPELNVGGVETGTLDLARNLVKLGHKAVVVSNGGALVKELESLGAVHYKLPVHEKSIFTIYKMIPQLALVIRKENIDIVHARSRVPAWIAYFACRRTKAIFITTCHGYYSNHLFSYVMGWAKRVIVLSNVIARHMVDDFEVPLERIRLIPRSVDLEKFKYISPELKRKDELNIGIIARMTPIKGHLDFIKAMAKVARVIPRVKIWIVGDAPPRREAYKEQVQVLVRRLGLWHCTQFLGVQRDIPAILANLDILVLATTTHEAFGRVIIEAQASGVPVVATKVGGVVDIIEDGKNGLFVPPSDPASMSEAVLKIAQDLDLSRRLAQEAYEKVKEKYNVESMANATLGVYEEARKDFSILIIKLSSVGDIILSSAAFRAIREKFARDFKITLLVGNDSKDAVLRCPYIDEVLVCDFKNKDKGLKGILSLGEVLRRKNFDFVIDLQNNRKSHILSALSFATERYGYHNKKLGFLLNHGIKDDKEVALGPLIHQFRILKMLGIELNNSHLEAWPTQEDFHFVRELLKSEWASEAQKFIGINISASPRWATKNWPVQQISRLCEALSQKDLRVVITGVENDLPRAAALINAAKNARIINACGKTTINQLAALIKECSVYITCDSAPLHIAAAMDTPFVALFGPTDPARHMPAAGNYVLIKRNLACSPCYKANCKNTKCMKQITAEEVLEAVEKLLKENVSKS